MRPATPPRPPLLRAPTAPSTTTALATRFIGSTLSIFSRFDVHVHILVICTSTFMYGSIVVFFRCVSCYKQEIRWRATRKPNKKTVSVLQSNAASSSQYVKHPMTRSEKTASKNRSARPRTTLLVHVCIVQLYKIKCKNVQT